MYRIGSWGYGEGRRKSSIERLFDLEHSPEFRALRDAILDDLADEDRRRLAGLLGCMTAPLGEPSPSLVAVLAEIAQLSVGDRARLARWCGRYLSQWGQIPVAASRRVRPKARY
jgi:hypothetical protein